MPRGTEPLLRVAALRKTFGGLHALEDINLEVWPGEVVGLVGDNGAGKSTLVRCISGYYTPDAGEITVDGQSLGSGGPKRAAELRIEIVHQDLSLVMHGDVVQNLYLNREIRSSWAPLGRLGLARQEGDARWRSRDPRSGWDRRNDLRSAARAGSLRGPASVHRDRTRRRLEPAHGVPRRADGRARRAADVTRA
jgi:ABC-type Fe3+/spermidine/putrescine transport system ATPase subunit